MIEKPILFSGPMVRAILENRKTQTRRVLKSVGNFDQVFQMDDGSWHITDSQGGHMSPVSTPYSVGDRLWVREAWRAELSWQSLKPSYIPQGAAIFYESDGSKRDNGMGAKFPGKLRPGMFMPRWASRITLEVTAVKVERLQDISEADCYAEGCEQDDADGVPVWYVSGTGILPHPDTGQKCYRLLWESINGPGSWDANPWVAAYTFKRVTP